MTETIKKISVQGSPVALEDSDAQVKILNVTTELSTNDTVAKANSAVQPAAIADMETSTHAAATYETKSDANAVKTRVSALETTVGNSSSGLVKDIADLEASVTNLDTKKADKATTLAGYGITDTYTKAELEGKIAGAFHYKGSVNDYDDLPVDDNIKGDVWNIRNADPEHHVKAGDNVVWTGSSWDVLSGIVDLSAYRTAAEQNTIDSEITSNINTHKADTTAHTTEAEKLAWNAKQDALTNAALLETITSEKLAQIETNKTNITALDENKVAKTTTVNGHALSDNVTVSAADVGAYTTTEVDTKLSAKADSANLATVATTGSYNDLTNKPFIPSKTSDITNDSDFTTKAYADTELAKKQNNLSDIQLEAVNSGITSEKRASYDSHIANEVKHITSDERTLWNTVSNKSDKASVEALTTRVLTAENKITTVEGKIGDASSGLIKDVNSLEANKADKNNVYTKTETDTLLSAKQGALTETQIAAVNSGINAVKVAKYDSYETSINNKQDKLDSEQMKAVNSGMTAQKVYQLDQNTTNISTIGTNLSEGLLKTLDEKIATKQGTLTEAQMAAVNSGVTNVLVTKITEAWPGSSGPTNKLATLADISTSSGAFIGSFEKMSSSPLHFGELETPPLVNDYMILYNIDVDEEITTEEEGTWSFKDKSKLPITAKNGETWVFKYHGSWYVNYRKGWIAEYRINEKPMTEEQLAAINSGITEAKRIAYDAHVADTDIHVTLENKAFWDAKQTALTEAQLTAVNSGIDSTKVAQIETNKTDIANLDSLKADKATTLAGYGILDAYTKSETDTELAKKADWGTTLSDYGITDAYTKTEANNTFVNKATTVNGYALSDNVDLTYTDVDALPDTTKYGKTLTTDVQSDKVAVSLKDQEAGTLSTVNMNVFTGATSEADGKVGLVPQPNAGDEGKFLRGDGIWVTNQDATWGKIVGTLSEQEDLQAALDLKATVANLEAEVTRATEAEADLASDLADEATAREEADDALDTRLTTAESDIDNLESDKEDKLTTANAGDGIKIERDAEGNVKISNTNVSAEWGLIEGELSNQEDLKAALDAKENNLTFQNGTGISVTRSGDTVTITNTQVSAVWGNITGTLSDQGDLKAALDSKSTNVALEAEVARATEAEGELSAAISAEETRATEAENTLSSSIIEEKTRAEGAESTLTTNLANEVSDREAAVLAEETRAKGVEGVVAEGKTLAGLISEEASAREIADEGLSSDISAERTRAIGAEDTLTENLAQEVSTREAAVSAEETRAKGVEEGLDTRLTTAEGDIDTLESSKEDKLTSANAGDGIKIERDTETGKVTISNTKVSAIWGNIDGTLSNQTDLQAALDLKATVANLEAEVTRAKGAEEALDTAKEDKLTNENAGDGIKIERDTETGKVTISNTNLSAEWGNIEGNLEDQLDLKAALDAKETVANVDLVRTRVTALETNSATKEELSTHTSNKSNPHEVTKAQVGLGNVDNTSDADKPVSNATQAALDLKADKATTYTKTEIDSKLSSVYKYKGTVETYEDLPTTDLTVGDVYNVVQAHKTAPKFPAGSNLAWAGEEEGWDILAGITDLSEYRKAADQDVIDATKETIANVDLVRTRVTNLETTVGDTESGLVKKANDLETAITAEENRAKGVEADLDEAITAETTRAEGAESDLADDISAEETRATEAEEELAGKISAEETRAKAAEEANATAITTEQGRAEAAEATLTAALEKEVEDREAAVSAEEARAKSVEGEVEEGKTLAGLIAEEATARGNADDTLTNDLAAEVERATAAETSLQETKQDNLVESDSIKIDEDQVITAVSAVVGGGSSKTANLKLNNGGFVDLEAETLQFINENTYAQAPITLTQLNAADSWEVGFTFKVNKEEHSESVPFSIAPSPITDSIPGEYGITLGKYWSKWSGWLSTNGTDWNTLNSGNIQNDLMFEVGQTYDIKFVFTGSAYTMYGKVHSSEEWLVINTAETTDRMPSFDSDIEGYITFGNSCHLGIYQSYTTFDLASCYVMLNGEEAWRGISSSTGTGVKGIVNLYDTTGTNEDGALTQKAASELFSGVNTQLNTLEADLTAEVARATEAEETLTNDLSDEITRATNAEATLTADLAAEVERATTAEQNLADSKQNNLTAGMGIDLVDDVISTDLCGYETEKDVSIITDCSIAFVASGAVTVDDNVEIGTNDITLDADNINLKGVTTVNHVLDPTDRSNKVATTAFVKAVSGDIGTLLDDEIARAEAAEEALDTRLTTAESDIDNLEEGKADKATTLAGYNIADAYTKTEVDNKVVLVIKDFSEE